MTLATDHPDEALDEILARVEEGLRQSRQLVAESRAAVEVSKLLVAHIRKAL